MNVCWLGLREDGGIRYTRGVDDTLGAVESYCAESDNHTPEREVMRTLPPGDSPCYPEWLRSNSATTHGVFPGLEDGLTATGLDEVVDQDYNIEDYIRHEIMCIISPRRSENQSAASSVQSSPRPALGAQSN